MWEFWKFHRQSLRFSERVYKETLDCVTQSFPQYVRELQGVADGAQVEFYKVKKQRFSSLLCKNKHALWISLIIKDNKKLHRHLIRIRFVKQFIVEVNWLSIILELVNYTLLLFKTL